MQHACFLGEWVLKIEEASWANEIPCWRGIVKKWNDNIKEYQTHDALNLGSVFTDEAKRQMQDWYAENVLVEELMMERE